MTDNINTIHYWENRFRTGDWYNAGGESQTRSFAESQIRHFSIPRDFEGTLLDFGCGTGDAFPVYRKSFPFAKLVGVDFSEAAIAECKRKYGAIAEFLVGGYEEVPVVDVIIASNVFEHLSDDIPVAKHLLSRCRHLYIIVPYKEQVLPGTEHVNSYDESYFKEVGLYSTTTFYSKGWSQYGLKGLWFNVYFLNLLRPFCGKPLLWRKKQILFHFETHRDHQSSRSSVCLNRHPPRPSITAKIVH